MEAADTVPVSIKAPFLSNLPVIDNITLVAEVHERSLSNDLDQVAMRKLETLGLGELALKHYTSLDEQQYFWVQLIRASMVENARIIVDRPFSMVSGQNDMNFIIGPLEQLNIESDKLVILELTSHEDYFGEGLCSIKRWQ